MFYASIPSFSDFSEVSEQRHYHALPDDWLLVIADIRDSTPAIAAGQYKNVNMVGAACITAVLNISDNHRVPYVFGGDGATLAIPAGLTEAAGSALSAVRRMARERFSLELRVGLVPVSEIRCEGVDVRVARFELSKGNCMAMFSGGGSELADRWVKTSARYLLAEPENDAEADLEGLSCRWEPLKSRNGLMLCMLVHASPGQDQQQVYRDVITRTAELMASDQQQGKPIAQSNMVLRWHPTRLDTEIETTRGKRNRLLSMLARYSHSLLGFLMDRFNISAGGYRPQQYRRELRQNSDYRRFDDMLRILFDCSEHQAEQIEAMLGQLQRQGCISYGLHRTSQALMTCIVFDFGQSEHIHFLDGDDGGFSLAAKQLKQHRPSTSGRGNGNDSRVQRQGAQAEHKAGHNGRTWPEDV